MTEKEIDKETKFHTERQESSLLGRWSHICTFLAGISFTCIILIMQQREKFEYSVKICNFEVRAVDMISLPLTTTFLLFMFGAFIFATASQSSEHAKIWGKKAKNVIYLGFLSMLTSLFSILAQISLWLSLIETGLAIVLSFYWVYTREDQKISE